MADEVAVAQGRRLAEVVEQRGEAQRGGLRRGGRVHGAERVVERVAGDRLRLRHPAERGELGQDHDQEPKALENPDRARRGRIERQDPHQLVADALRRDGLDGRRRLADRLLGGGIDRQLESSGEPCRPDQAKGVLGEALAWLADGAEDARVEIRLAADRVDERSAAGFEVDRQPRHRVDREVTPSEVLGQRDAEAHLVGAAPVAVRSLGPVRGDLDDRLGADRDRPEPVLPGRAGKEGDDLLGAGGGGGVPLAAMREPEEPVAHRAADDRDLVARVAQRADHSRTRSGRSGKTSSPGMTRILGPRRAAATDVDRPRCRSS